MTTAPPLIVVAGATATGKTALAIDLAEALRADRPHAEIISADSRQVFRGLDIGTAKVTAADRARVPAPRPRPGRPGRAVQRRRLRRPRRRGARRTSGSATASRSWPAARASTSARSPAASTPPRCRATATSAPGSRPSWTRAVWTPLVARLEALAPGSRRDRRPAQPAAGRPGARDRRAAGRRPATAGARVRRAGRLARARHGTRRRTRRIARRAPGPSSTPACSTRPATCASGSIRPAGLLGDRLPRGLGGPRRRARRATRPSSSTRGGRSRSPSASGRGSAPSRTSTGCRPARTRQPVIGSGRLARVLGG